MTLYTDQPTRNMLNQISKIVTVLGSCSGFYLMCRIAAEKEMLRNMLMMDSVMV